MKMRVWMGLVILFLGTSALAAGGAHGETGIPQNFIFAQILNVLLFAGILIYFLRPKVRHLFAERRSSFTNMMQKAEKARQEAEQQKKEISEKLRRLEKESETTKQRAKSEAEELRKKILHDAETLAERLQKDAERTAYFEAQRMKEELRNELLNHSLEKAKENLKSQLESQDQKRLQSEFVEKIQVVR